MNHTEILFDKNTCEEKKTQVANEIINEYNLHLSTRQILLAHDIIHKWCPDGHFKNNRIILLNKILNINTNLYIAVITAICHDYKPRDLCEFMIIDDGDCIDIGSGGSSFASSFASPTYFCRLLNYYEFDISNIPNIPDETKHKIEEYRQSKYSGKLTKSAIKNE